MGVHWKFFIISALSLCKCKALPDDSITSVASPDNFLIYEATNHRFSYQPGTPMKIQSDVPLSIHRYYGQDEPSAADPTNNNSDGVILVSSNCDTSGTNVVPYVEVSSGESGSSVIDIKLGIPEEEASDMPFLQSSSYYTVSYEYNCGTPKPTKLPSRILTSTTVGEIACLSESECDDMRQQNGIAKFQVIANYSTKGCFSKNNGVAYWGSGGSVEDNSKTQLPGIQERIWCEGEVEITNDNNVTDGPGDIDLPDGNAFGGPKDGTVCLTKDACDQMRLDMGVAKFQVGYYGTKGCFSKNGIAYWGRGGSAEDIAKSDLIGILERIWCGESSDNLLPISQCEIGPGADPAKSCGSKSKFCELKTGVCKRPTNDNSLSGICKNMPEVCNDMFQPVCGCDGTTHDNTCVAHSNGINVLHNGECNESPEGDGAAPLNGDTALMEEDDTSPNEDVVHSGDYVACLSKEECNEKRKELGIEDFYSGSFPSFGCFYKNGWAYWGINGSDDDISKARLPGIRERIWCNDSNSPSLAVGAKSSTVDVPQYTLNSGFSTKSFALISLLHSALSLHANVVPYPQLKSADFCTYHAEVLISGCQDCASGHVEVAAPKARVINSVTENTEAETYDVHEKHTLQVGTHICKESKHTTTLTFPDDHAIPL